MAHIVEFAVTDLAGSKGVKSYELHRDVNVFFGQNGSGKTTILKILNSAMENDVSLLLNAPFTSAEVLVYSQRHDKVFKYQIDRDRILGSQEGQQSLLPGLEKHPIMFRRDYIRRQRQLAHIEEHEEFGWAIDPPLPETETKWQHRYLPTSRLLSLVAQGSVGIERIVENEDILDLNFEQFLENKWLEFYGNIISNVRGFQERALISILGYVFSSNPKDEHLDPEIDSELAYQQMKTFISRQVELVNVPSLKEFKDKYESEPLIRNVVGLIDDVERAIAASTQPRTRFQELIERMFSGNKKLTLGETSVSVVADDERRIGLRSLSSGEKQLLYLLFESLRADVSTLFIDEPEISLHIDWQTELLGAMLSLNSEMQIIAATHSPEIVGRLDDSKIFRI